MSNRRGVTVTELLVVSGIIGLLASLVLPAVQSSRESARRAQCADRLRQIGTALHGHEAAHGRFPRGGDMIQDGTSGQWPRSHAPHLYLLPYLDQGELFERIDRLLIAERTAMIFPGVNDANEQWKRTGVAIFLCPSDPSGLANRRNNYRANVGLTAFPRDPNVPRDPPLPGAGAFYPVHRFPYAQHFHDGLSQTAAFSEKLAGDGSDESFTPGADYFNLGFVADVNGIWNAPDSEALHSQACGLLADPNPPHESTVGQFWFYAGFPDTWYNHILTPNSRVPDCGTRTGMFGSGVMPARSAHPGGVNSLMMDGSLRFISDSVDTRVWHALGTRNGSDSIQ